LINSLSALLGFLVGVTNSSAARAVVGLAAIYGLFSGWRGWGVNLQSRPSVRTALGKTGFDGGLIKACLKNPEVVGRLRSLSGIISFFASICLVIAGADQSNMGEQAFGFLFLIVFAITSYGFRKLPEPSDLDIARSRPVFEFMGFGLARVCLLMIGADILIYEFLSKQTLHHAFSGLVGVGIFTVGVFWKSIVVRWQHELVQLTLVVCCTFGGIWATRPYAALREFLAATVAFILGVALILAVVLVLRRKSEPTQLPSDGLFVGLAKIAALKIAPVTLSGVPAGDLRRFYNVWRTASNVLALRGVEVPCWLLDQNEACL
jgi:hypothetical protein